jgi:hypothetical protein
MALTYIIARRYLTEALADQNYSKVWSWNKVWDISAFSEKFRQMSQILSEMEQYFIKLKRMEKIKLSHLSKYSRRVKVAQEECTNLLEIN